MRVRSTRSWGRTEAARATLAAILAGREGYEITFRPGDLQWTGFAGLGTGGTGAGRAVSGFFNIQSKSRALIARIFLKSALNEIRKHQGQPELDAMEFLSYVKDKIKLLELNEDLLRRSVNEGFSGGEKKRNEIFQMAVLEPRLAVLDETDSGLDIDALKIVSHGVNKLRRDDNAQLVITHYQRLLNYIVPDFVHVLVDGGSSAQEISS